MIALLQNTSIEALVMVLLIYKGHTLNKEYVIDILVEQEIIMELKAIEGLLPVHEAQSLAI